jgi:hypothetical protein
MSGCNARNQGVSGHSGGREKGSGSREKKVATPAATAAYLNAQLHVLDDRDVDKNGNKIDVGHALVPARPTVHPDGHPDHLPM